MASATSTSRARQELLKGFWKENPVFIAVLGLCPTMAVTNTLVNGLIMAGATTFVLVGSSFLISLLRNIIPRQVRISVFIVVIATFVTVVDYGLAAYVPDQYPELAAFIQLIVVNCIILGRAEAFASKNGVGYSVLDALGMSGGFGIALCMIGAIREVFGSGTLLGVSLFGDGFEPWVIMVMPPGGFLTLGVLLTLFAWIKERNAKKQQARALTAGRGAA